MKSNLLNYVGVAALLIAFSACDRNDNDIEPPDEDLGTFEATISGDVSASFEGTAVFAEYHDPETEERFFTIAFGSPLNGRALNIWFVRGGEFPGAGTFNIQQLDMEELEEDWYFDKEEFVGFFLFHSDDQAEPMELYFTESGSITIELTDHNSIRGDFDVTASGMSMDFEQQQQEELQIQITSTFHAAFGEVQFPDFEDAFGLTGAPSFH